MASDVRERILAGDLAPGGPLRESLLAGEMAVSRNTLREGLRLLVSEGLVNQELYKGAVVATISADQVRDIYRARRILEPQAVAASALHPDVALIPLEAAVLDGESAVAQRRWRDVGTASLRFHQALVSLLASPLCDEFYRRLSAQLRLAWGEARDEEEFQNAWPERDRDLYELLRQGRVRHAQGVLAVYLDDAERQVLAALRAAQAGTKASGRSGFRAELS
ncbi:GntR family transcriptional regulator [Microtetraspora malaysiensis]|uniref:GntR family transcriptional regulator n=1 Tax=Microtetraspora malaysiensis TaxID=161358 RepID=UPI003D8FE553